MARSTNAPCKGRIQMRKTNHLHLFTFGLQRTAGPYRWVKTGKAQGEHMFSALPLRADIALSSRHAVSCHVSTALRVGKSFLHVAGLVGAAMCSAYRCGSHDRWP